MSPMEQLAKQEYERGYSDGKSDYFAAGVAEGEMRARQRMIANRVVANQHPFAASGKPIDHIASTGKMIDHANSDCTDNRIENLRQCDDAENNFNSSLRKDNKSGVKGIYWKAKEQKWCALISTRGKRKHVGYFKELNDAIAALTAVRSELHKEFANHG